MMRFLAGVAAGLAIAGVAAIAVLHFGDLEVSEKPDPQSNVPLVEVPDVIGQTAPDAKDEIENAGLTAKTEFPLDYYKPAPTVPITTQNPDPGAEVEEGSVVSIHSTK